MGILYGFIAALAISQILPAAALTLVHRDSPMVVSMQIHRSTESKIFQSRSVQKRTSPVSVTLDNFEDGALYFANMTIGTPAQNFRLHLDTGSSDMWTNVATSSFCEENAQASAEDIACSISGTYSANDSSTYKYIDSDFEIQYADGSEAVGDYVSDTVRIGGVTLTSQQFGVGYTSSSSQGILGIGYPKLEVQYQDPETGESPSTYANVPQSLVNQGYINSNAYSLWLDDLDSSTGNILFGGVDTDKYEGSLLTLDIVPEAGSYYEMLITLDSISSTVSGSTKTVLDSAVTVLLDSGTTLTYLPEDTVSSIYSAIGAQYSSRQGVAFVSCDLANSSDTLTFNFGSKSITAAMSQMVFEGGISSSLNCYFGIAPQSVSGSSMNSVAYILGDAFLRNAYVVYDLANNQISLAQTNTKSTSTNILEITSGSSGVPNATGTTSSGTSNSNSSTSGSSLVLPSIYLVVLQVSIVGSMVLFATALL